MTHADEVGPRSTADMPPPGVIAAEIVEDLEAALAEFAEIAESLGGVGIASKPSEPILGTNR